MNNLLFKNILRFIVLVFIQVLVFNKIYLGGYINPYVFLMFVVLLPFETPWWVLLLSSFGIGLSVDLLTGSIGIHAMATTFVAFARPLIIRILLPKLDRSLSVVPGIGYMGVPAFAVYTLILVFIHHTLFFSVEVLRFNELGHILLRTLLSSIITTFLILILEMIFRKK